VNVNLGAHTFTLTWLHPDDETGIDVSVRTPVYNEGEATAVIAAVATGMTATLRDLFPLSEAPRPEEP
jgi:hypothetical protein